MAGGFGLKTWLSNRSSSTQSVQTSKVTLGTVSTTISGSGTVRSGQSSTINWQTSGTVASVNVQIGQQVKAGDVLATLDPTTLSSSIIEAQAELIDAQAALDELLAPQPLEIAQAEAALITAQENLDNLLNPTALAVAQAESAVTDAQKALDTLKNPTALAIAQAETAVTEAQDGAEYPAEPRSDGYFQGGNGCSDGSNEPGRCSGGCGSLEVCPQQPKLRSDAAKATYDAGAG